MRHHASAIALSQLCHAAAPVLNQAPPARSCSTRARTEPFSWSGSTQGARSFAELPTTRIKYVRWVEALVGCPMALLSTSPKREVTILMTDPFRD